MTSLRTVAFYLPQFHPIPENDLWWGRGFTEWTNVVKARPLYSGHHQPHLPADLGFYDLRIPEVRQQQANLARDHGISAFCYYHYWFNGRRLLERPFQEVLDSGSPDFPFLLCWANENWTRAWDGGASKLLVEQSHSVEDDRNHLRWLAAAFNDPRYLRVDGKAVYLVYRVSELPDPLRTTEVWREQAARLGVGELHLVRVNSFYEAAAGDPRQQGFDAELDWIPNWAHVGQPLFRRRWDRWNPATRLVRNQHVVPYAEVVAQARAALGDPGPVPRYPCVVPTWDNSPRRTTEAVIFDGSTPALYAEWLYAAGASALRGDTEPLVFVNAWNEWGEGNHLEPDQRWGRAYLEATREVLIALAATQQARPSG